MELLDHDQSISHNHFNAREFARDDVAIVADIRVAGGARNKVRVVDLSQTGFRMDCLTYIPADRLIFLTMPGFVQMESRIIWRSEWSYGCEFARPLHTAIHEHIVKTYPALMPCGLMPDQFARLW